MEPANIDWEKEKQNSVFVEEHIYENINAPQWIDFLSPLPDRHQDVAWFCRPDCKHPSSADDFLNLAPPSSSPFKLLRSPSVSKLIGLVNLKRRAGVLPPSNEDGENQDPNFLTPARQINYLSKAGVKSSAQKGDQDGFSDILLAADQVQDQDQIKPAQHGKDLFGKITEFCNELKKMASRAKENNEKLAECITTSDKPSEEKLSVHSALGVGVEIKSGPPKERLPLLPLETGKDTPEAAVAKGKPKKNKIRRADEAENIPVSINLNSIKSKEEGTVLGIRTNPPTPQGFSATRGPLKTRPCISSMGKEVVEEAAQKKNAKEEDGETRSVCSREGRALDVFWFLKPCTLSS